MAAVVISGGWPGVSRRPTSSRRWTGQEAIAARRQAIAERDRSQRLSADLTLEKGLTLAASGQADRGLHWMLEALQTAPRRAEEFRQTVRRNLGAWLGQVHRPLKFHDVGYLVRISAFSPDGRSS